MRLVRKAKYRGRPLFLFTITEEMKEENYKINFEDFRSWTEKEKFENQITMHCETILWIRREFDKIWSIIYSILLSNHRKRYVVEKPLPGTHNYVTSRTAAKLIALICFQS